MALQHISHTDIGKHSYYISPSPLARLPATYLDLLQQFEIDNIPTTAITCDNDTLSGEDIQSAYQTFAEKDDVWSHNFTTRTLNPRSRLKGSAEFSIQSRSFYIL